MVFPLELPEEEDRIFPEPLAPRGPPPPRATARLIDAQQQFSIIHLSEILRRPADNLPDYVKGSVEWRDYHTHGPGYYLLDPHTKHYDPVEFFYEHLVRSSLLRRKSLHIRSRTNPTLFQRNRLLATC